jgi:hypothetical protein
MMARRITGQLRSKGKHMSDVEKMYKAPDNLGSIQTPTEGATGVSANTRLFLGEAAPWLKFLGVMGFIGCGFMVLGGIVMMLVPAALSSVSNAYGKFGGAMGIGFAFLFLGLAVILFFPARFMYKMGAAGSAYKMAAQANALEEVALNLRKWAKFYGIMIIIIIGIYILAIIGVIVAGIAAKSL